MGTLRKVKLAAKLDHSGDGNIDTIAADLTGDGEFDLYIKDTDGNGTPDTVILFDENDEVVAMTEDKAKVEETAKAVAARIFLALQAKEIIAEELDKMLKEIDKEIRKARKELDHR